MKNKIWNISSSLGFAEILAQRFLDEYAGRLPELAEVLFLLPNRRAVRAMKEAFVRLRGLTPMLLPRMMPLGEVEEDELFLTGGNFWTACIRRSERPSGCCCLLRLSWPSRRSSAWRR